MIKRNNNHDYNHQIIIRLCPGFYILEEIHNELTPGAYRINALIQIYMVSKENGLAFLWEQPLSLEEMKYIPCIPLQPKTANNFKATW